MVENFGPGALDRMGFTWEHIQELNPSMIVASVKGFADGHHYEDLKVYENVAQCAGGAASTTGFWDGPPTGQRRCARRQQHRHAPRDRHPDRLHRQQQDRQGPEGRRVDAGRGAEPVPRQAARPAAPGHASATWRSTRSTRTARSRDVVPRGGNAGGGGQPGWVLKCKGWETDPNAYIYFTIQGHAWAPICDAIGKPEWTDDPAYTTPKARQPHIFDDLRDDREVAGRQDQVRGGRHPAQVRHPVLAGAVDEGNANDRSLRESGTDRRGRAQGARQVLDRRQPDQVLGPQARDQGSPLLGEHTDEVLAELGYSKEQIAKLHAAKAV